MAAIEITVEDYEKRTGKQVAESDAERVSMLLEEAVAVIFSDAAFSYRENDSDQEMLVKMCGCSMVERRLSSETGSDDGWTTQSSITTGPFSKSFSRPAPMAGMSLLPSERRLLGMEDCMIGCIAPLIGGRDA